MRKTCDLITGFIKKNELEKTIKENLWYKAETPALSATCYPFMIGFGLLANHFKYVYNTFFDVYSNGYTWFYASEADSLKVGRMLYEGFLKDENFIYKKQAQWREDLSKLYQKAKQIVRSDLTKLENREIAKIFEDYLKAFYIAWTIPLILEMNTVYVEQVLVPKLRKNLNITKVEFNEIMVVLSAPQERSYITLERIDFLKLALNFSKKSLDDHFQKYYWLKSSYRRIGNYSRQEMKKLANDEVQKGKKHIREEIGQLEDLPREISNKQRKFIKKCKISEHDQKLFRALGIFGDWQDKRKEMNIYGNHHLFILLHEIARRLNLEIDLVAQAFPSETVNALVGKLRLDEKELEKRFAFSIHAIDSKLREIFLVGPEAEELHVILERKIEEKFKEIKGMVASVGGTPKVRGEVRVVLDPFGVDIPNGSILVTPMTRPDFIHLLHKAAAVVTDQGGVTSHAAIIAREFGIPCIVGTGTATKLLKDGDLVEVDCENGVVIKL